MEVVGVEPTSKSGDITMLFNMHSHYVWHVLLGPTGSTSLSSQPNYRGISLGGATYAAIAKFWLAGNVLCCIARTIGIPSVTLSVLSNPVTPVNRLQ